MHSDFVASFHRKSGPESALFFSHPRPQYFAKTEKAALFCLDAFFRASQCQSEGSSKIDVKLQHKVTIVFRRPINELVV